MKSIFIAASPNAQRDDVWTAFKQLLRPWSWYSKKPVIEFENKFADYLGVKNAIGVDSARSSFYLTLKAMGIGKGDEVLMPAYTCVVIVNPVLWTGAKPVFVDIDRQSFNIDFDDLEKKITPKCKAILVQHTFGVPVDMDRMMEFAEKNNLKVIEDIAHSIGGKYKNKVLGTFGDAAVATFGIEKVMSTVRGGMIVTNNDSLAEKIREEVRTLPNFDLYKVLVSLFNPIFWWKAKPFYYTGFGKLTLGRFEVWLTRVFNATGRMIEDCEYKAIKPKWIPAKMPGALAKLGLKQLSKLDKYNKHRERVERFYREKLGKLDSENIIDADPVSKPGTILLRYPILVKNQKELHGKAKKNKIILGNWYDKMFFVPEEDWHHVGYKKGSAPNAEWVAKRIVNLPMHWVMGEEEVGRVVDLLAD